jgi:hypothetical protein
LCFPGLGKPLGVSPGFGFFQHLLQGTHKAKMAFGRHLALLGQYTTYFVFR